ncbi:MULTISPECIES: DUF4307 domain-containing protein [Actinosynnema]|uniref:DUF4307 domain-containing protein n=1 Tax=Actinosynnema pretiosum TaxID=42197 RepID=A0A290Z0E5_9PSEU|nr:DUF4307 domain-containing protein [Actinosynnema pretiosum]ATE52474.1 hypothetical protein CNX65_03535 [Actinosynnema pretiosum]
MARRELPEGRYGTARKPLPKWARWSLLVAGVLAGAAVGWAGYANFGSSPIASDKLRYNALGDDLMEVVFTVDRDQPERPVVCVLRALSLDGEEAGRREVLVPASDGGTVETGVVRTSKPPVTGEVFGCSYEVPAYLNRE